MYAVHALTAGHRTFSVQYLHVSVHFSIRAATMSEQSEREQTESCAGPSKRTQGSSDKAPLNKKRGVSKTGK